MPQVPELGSGVMGVKRRKHHTQGQFTKLYRGEGRLRELGTNSAGPTGFT